MPLGSVGGRSDPAHPFPLFGPTLATALAIVVGSCVGTVAICLPRRIAAHPVVCPALAGGITVLLQAIALSAIFEGPPGSVLVGQRPVLLLSAAGLLAIGAWWAAGPLRRRVRGEAGADQQKMS